MVASSNVRFVVRGFSQKEGVDYESTFSPVARYASIQDVIYIASIMRWRIHQMDVKTTFLNEIIEEEVYISPSSPVKRPGWLLKTLRDVSEVPMGVVKERMPPRKFANYMALMSNIIDVDPSSFEEAIDQHVWWDAMVEEYTSIMRNDVCNIVPRLAGKLVVSFMWLYKIKHVADGRIKKFKARFVVRGFS
jgi:hypothetical protein